MHINDYNRLFELASLLEDLFEVKGNKIVAKPGLAVLLNKIAKESLGNKAHVTDFESRYYKYDITIEKEE